MLFRWDAPDDAHATLVGIALADDVGTTEADVWRALEVLRGARTPARPGPPAL